MRFINTYKNVELVISKRLLEMLSKEGIQHFPNEFGGFLMGYYSIDFKILTITDTIYPKVYQGSPCLFQRSIKGIDSVFESYYEKQPIQYYVGEWHTHPNGSTCFSCTDKRAMINIARCTTVNITNPILLIISTNNTGVNGFQFYLYEDENLLPFIKISK